MTSRDMIAKTETVRSDQELEIEIERLQSTIQSWAEKNDIWFDSGFTTYAKHVDAEPGENPVVSILYSDGEINDVINGLGDQRLHVEFYELVDELGFLCETASHGNHHFYSENPELTASFRSYYEWKWVCSLVQDDCSDVYEELYAYFAKNPNKLYELDWRQYETFLFRIFQNQGFNALLGPGQNDGGIDIKLLQTDPIGDILTLVQAKKYAPHNKIGLEAVAALHGVSEVEGAEKSLFVTTSSYQPTAKKFAGRTKGKLDLRTSDDVVTWCETASSGIIKNKASLVTKNSVSQRLSNLTGKSDPRILHAHTGVTMVMNGYALVIKETKHAALLLALPHVVVSDDGYGQVGTQVPDLKSKALSLFGEEHVWRAKRREDNGKITYWDGHNLYSQWNGKAQEFSYLD